MQEESEEAMDKEAVGEFIDSIVMAPERGGVDEKAEGLLILSPHRQDSF